MSNITIDNDQAMPVCGDRTEGITVSGVAYGSDHQFVAALPAILERRDKQLMADILSGLKRARYDVQA